jgi:hypothetical protein
MSIVLHRMYTIILDIIRSFSQSGPRDKLSSSDLGTTEFPPTHAVILGAMREGCCATLNDSGSANT